MLNVLYMSPHKIYELESQNILFGLFHFKRQQKHLATTEDEQQRKKKN